MALKSEKWFSKKCLAEPRSRSRLTYFASRALDLGLGSENTSGHVRQAVGAAQEFLAANPGLRAQLRVADSCQPLDLAAARVLGLWTAFLGLRAGAYGRTAFGYRRDTLRGYLTGTYGGPCMGGGGGDNEFHIVLRAHRGVRLMQSSPRMQSAGGRDD
jgi:hypothetical protein